MLLRVLAPGVDLPCDERRDVRIGVDLAVRVVQGDAHVRAAILERKDLPNARKVRELRGAMSQVADVRTKGPQA